MLIFIPLAIVSIILGAWWFSRARSKKISVFVNGLIPSEPGAESKAESGTTVWITYWDNEADQPGEEIFRGYANEKGIVSATIDSKNVGRSVLIRVRHAAYVFEDLKMNIPEYGLVHTVKMNKDGVYNGKIRGADVGNLEKYYHASVTNAEEHRTQILAAQAKADTHPMARIPSLFWLLSYCGLLLSSALDFWRMPKSFSLEQWDSFLHAVYFSAVTITTLGYGDIHPYNEVARIGVSLEAVGGILILGFALNSIFNRTSL